MVTESLGMNLPTNQSVLENFSLVWFWSSCAWNRCQRGTLVYLWSMAEEGGNFQILVVGERKQNGLMGRVELMPQVLFQESVLGKNDILQDVSSQKEGNLNSRSSSSRLNANDGKNEYIWTRKFQTDEDMRATDLMLDYLATPKISQMLGDKRTNKAKLWQDVAQHLINNRLKVAENLKDAGVKCHQKWRNLERNYAQFMSHVANTENITKKPPNFLEKLHPLLGKKHHSAPVVVEVPPDILDEDATTSEQDLQHLDEGTYIIEAIPASPPPNKNKKPDGELRAQRRLCDKLALQMVQNFQAFRREEEKRFQLLYDHLKRTEEDRKRLTDALVNYLNKTAGKNSRRVRDDKYYRRKKRRFSSSSD